MTTLFKHVDGEAVPMSPAEVAALEAWRASVGAAPPAVPGISDRQFFQALALPPYEIITMAEALAAVKTGELPAALAAIVAAIPDPVARFNAEMILSGATTFEATHPMVLAIASAMSPPWGQPEIIAFWTFAAGL
jgi:hypothetical protein